MATREEVLKALKSALPEATTVHDVVVLGQGVTVELVPRGGSREELGKRAREAALGVARITTCEVRWTEPPAGREIAADDPIPTVKNVVLVMSGKGGVGKSTTAANLTMAMQRAGYRS